MRQVTTRKPLRLGTHGKILYNIVHIMSI